MSGYPFNVSILDGDCPNRLLIATLIKHFEIPSDVINNKDYYIISKSKIKGYSHMVKKRRVRLPHEYHIRQENTWEYDTTVIGKSYFYVLIKTKVLEQDEYEHYYPVDFDQELRFSAECENDGNGNYWYHISFIGVKRV